MAFEANKEVSVNNCINTGKSEHECHKIVDELAAAAVAKSDFGTVAENIIEGQIPHCERASVQCYFQLDNSYCASYIKLSGLVPESSGKVPKAREPDAQVLVAGPGGPALQPSVLHGPAGPALLPAVLPGPPRARCPARRQARQPARTEDCQLHPQTT